MSKKDIIHNPVQMPVIDIFPIIGRIIQAGKRFFEVLFHGDDVKSKEAFNEKKSTADDIMQLNEALVEYRRKVQVECKEIENNVKDACQEVFGQIIQSLEFANSDYEFFRLENAQRRLDRTLGKIEGIFEKHVARRISLDDADCVAILKMPPGDVKGLRMTELKKKVFEETINELCKLLEEFQEDFFGSLDMSISARLDSLEDRIIEKTKTYEAISKESANNAEKKEELVMRAGYIYSLTELFETF